MRHPETGVCIARGSWLTTTHHGSFINHAMCIFAFEQAARALQGAEYDGEILFLGSANAAADLPSRHATPTGTSASSGTSGAVRLASGDTSPRLSRIVIE